jgi:hypothetical protein
MEEFALQKCCENTRTQHSHLGLVAAPFCRFFIANTLHHRLLVVVLFISRGLGVQLSRGGITAGFSRMLGAFLDA